MVRFEEVKIKGIRRWRTPDGKRRQETKVFMQTLNPWNVNLKGQPKTRPEIFAELQGERRAWEATEVTDEQGKR